MERKYSGKGVEKLAGRVFLDISQNDLRLICRAIDEQMRVYVQNKEYGSCDTMEWLYKRITKGTKIELEDGEVLGLESV